MVGDTLVTLPTRRPCCTESVQQGRQLPTHKSWRPWHPSANPGGISRHVSPLLSLLRLDTFERISDPPVPRFGHGGPTVLIASRLRLAVRAVQHKLRLLTAYDTFWPAAASRREAAPPRTSRRVHAQALQRAARCPRERTTVPLRTGPPLFLAGHVLGLGGYDHLVLNVLKGLTESGVNVCRDPRCVLPQTTRPGRTAADRTPPQEAASPAARGRPAAPRSGAIDRTRSTAAFTMWETDTLPPDEREATQPLRAGDRAERLGARSLPRERRDGADRGRAAGVRPAVFLTSPSGRGRRLTRRSSSRVEPGVPSAPPARSTRAGLRKNVQRVIDLFRCAFPAQPDVRLRVKITPNSPPVNTHGDPRIDVIDAHLSPAELADWYRSLTAYVNASAGRRVRAAPARSDGVRSAADLVDVRRRRVRSSIRELGTKSGYRLVGAWNAIYRGTWADPDDGDLIDRMRQVCRSPRRGEATRRRGRGAGAPVPLGGHDPQAGDRADPERLHQRTGDRDSRGEKREDHQDHPRPAARCRGASSSERYFPHRGHCSESSTTSALQCGHGTVGGPSSSYSPCGYVSGSSGS